MITIRRTASAENATEDRSGQPCLARRAARESRALDFDAGGALVPEINNVFGDEHDTFLSDCAPFAPDFLDTDPARFTCDSGETLS